MQGPSSPEGKERVKSNVLPFPSLRQMPPDPPRHRWLRVVGLQALVLFLLIAVVVVVDALFSR